MLSKIRDYVSISFIPRNKIEKVQISKTCGKHYFKAKWCGFDASRAVLVWRPPAVRGPAPKLPESPKVS